MEVFHLLKSQNIIGEGPVWDEGIKALYWVDIAGKTINRFWPDTGKHEIFTTESEVGVIAFREKNGFITAGSTGFSFWSPETKKFEAISDPEEANPKSRFNDGKVDRFGRFWAGTMTAEGAVSALYRMDTDLSIQKIDSGLTISNGIAWSPDNSVMYFVDSMRYVIYAYDFEGISGEVSNRCNFIQVSPDYGIPDGITVDSEGCLWCAFYGGSKVTRFDNEGNVMVEIAMPVTQPTSCIFGGDNYSDLYITSAWNGLDNNERKKQPLAGDLFVINTDIKGLPEPKFAG